MTAGWLWRTCVVDCDRSWAGQWSTPWHLICILRGLLTSALSDCLNTFHSLSLYRIIWRALLLGIWWLLFLECVTEILAGNWQGHVSIWVRLRNREFDLIFFVFDISYFDWKTCPGLFVCVLRDHPCQRWATPSHSTAWATNGLLSGRDLIKYMTFNCWVVHRVEGGWGVWAGGYIIQYDWLCDCITVTNTEDERRTSWPPRPIAPVRL